MFCFCFFCLIEVLFICLVWVFFFFLFFLFLLYEPQEADVIANSNENSILWFLCFHSFVWGH